MVRGEDLFVARLVHPSHEMHDRVDAREDLDQLVRLLDRPDRDLRAEQAERFPRLSAPDGRSHLVTLPEGLHDRSSEEP